MANKKGIGQTEWSYESLIRCGVVDQIQYFSRVSRTWLEHQAKEGESPVDVNVNVTRFGIRTRVHWKLRSNFEKNLENLNINPRPIAY